MAHRGILRREAAKGEKKKPKKEGKGEGLPSHCFLEWEDSRTTERKETRGTIWKIPCPCHEAVQSGRGRGGGRREREKGGEGRKRRPPEPQFFSYMDSPGCGGEKRGNWGKKRKGANVLMTLFVSLGREGGGTEVQCILNSRRGLAKEGGGGRGRGGKKSFSLLAVSIARRGGEGKKGEKKKEKKKGRKGGSLYSREG